MLQKLAFKAAPSSVLVDLVPHFIVLSEFFFDLFVLDLGKILADIRDLRLHAVDVLLLKRHLWLAQLLSLVHHDTDPVFEVLLHFQLVVLNELLYILNLTFLSLQLVQRLIIDPLLLVDFFDELLLFRNILLDLAIHQSLDCLFFPELLQLVLQLLDPVSRIVQSYAHNLGLVILRLEQFLVFGHGLVFSVALPEQLEALSSVHQLLIR